LLSWGDVVNVAAKPRTTGFGRCAVFESCATTLNRKNFGRWLVGGFSFAGTPGVYLVGLLASSILYFESKNNRKSPTFNTGFFIPVLSENNGLYFGVLI
jgi:hypothetical protein